MSQHLLILGAGVDRTASTDFPLANTLQDRTALEPSNDSDNQD
jgi:hypothetical protein